MLRKFKHNSYKWGGNFFLSYSNLIMQSYRGDGKPDFPVFFRTFFHFFFHFFNKKNGKKTSKIRKNPEKRGKQGKFPHNTIMLYNEEALLPFLLMCRWARSRMKGVWSGILSPEERQKVRMPLDCFLFWFSTCSCFIVQFLSRTLATKCQV